MPLEHAIPRIDNTFTYHAPKPGQPEVYESIRSHARGFAYMLEQHCPASRELERAIEKLDEAVMLANAAIARHG